MFELTITKKNNGKIVKEEFKFDNHDDLRKKLNDDAGQEILLPFDKNERPKGHIWHGKNLKIEMSKHVIYEIDEIKHEWQGMPPGAKNIVVNDGLHINMPYIGLANYD